MQEKQRPNKTLLGITVFVLLLLVSGRVFPQNADEDYLAGCASIIKGSYSDAIMYLSSAITRNNSDENLFLKRGASYLNLKDYAHAVDDFKEANLINPGAGDIWLARAFALSGNNENAIIYLRSHLNSEWRLPEDSIQKDNAFNSLQSATEWYTLWQKDWYSDEEKSIADITFYAGKGLYDEANSRLSAELSRNPDSRSLIFLKAKISFDQGNYAAAIADYTTAIDMDRNNALYYALRGAANLKAERYKEALSDLNKAIRSDPAGFNLYIKRAEAYAGLQSWQSAIKDLLLYLKYFEDVSAVQFQCGNYYYEAGDYINALKYYSRLLKEDPDNSSYFKARGKTYLKTATYRYAISDLSMSLDLNPDDAETWMSLGLAKLQSGDKENGCSDLQRSQRMGNAEVGKYILENCK
jgi:tetratricopeptide (TPR) repeat protein